MTSISKIDSVAVARQNNVNNIQKQNISFQGDPVSYEQKPDSFELQGEKQGMSTGAKVGIGALIALGVAVAADFGLAGGRHVKKMLGMADNVKPKSNIDDFHIEQKVTDKFMTNVEQKLQKTLKDVDLNNLDKKAISYDGKIIIDNKADVFDNPHVIDEVNGWFEVEKLGTGNFNVAHYNFDGTCRRLFELTPDKKLVNYETYSRRNFLISNKFSQAKDKFKGEDLKIKRSIENANSKPQNSSIAPEVFDDSDTIRHSSSHYAKKHKNAKYDL